MGVCFKSFPPNVSFLHGVIDADYAKEEGNDADKDEHSEEHNVIVADYVKEEGNDYEQQPENIVQGKKKRAGDDKIMTRSTTRKMVASSGGSTASSADGGNEGNEGKDINSYTLERLIF